MKNKRLEGKIFQIDFEISQTTSREAQYKARTALHAAVARVATEGGTIAFNKESPTYELARSLASDYSDKKDAVVPYLTPHSLEGLFIIGNTRKNWDVLNNKPYQSPNYKVYAFKSVDGAQIPDSQVEYAEDVLGQDFMKESPPYITMVSQILQRH